MTLSATTLLHETYLELRSRGADFPDRDRWWAIVERYKVCPSKTPRAGGIGKLFNASGQMDTQTAFEVYWTGDEAKPHKAADKISPARGGAISYGGGYWTIVHLNYKLFANAPQVWANLPALCSPLLKAALLTKTTP